MQRGSEKSLTNSKVTEREIHQLLSILNAELKCSKSNNNYCDSLQPPDTSRCIQRCEDNAEKLRRLKQENEEIRQRIKDIRCMRKTLKVAQKCQEEKKKCCSKKKSSESVRYGVCNESLAKSVESLARPQPKAQDGQCNEIKELQNRLNRLKEENAEIENIIKSLQCDQSQPQAKGADKKPPPPPPQAKCPEIPKCPDKLPPPPPPPAKCPEKPEPPKCPEPEKKGPDPCEINFAEFKKYQKANDMLNRELNNVKKENASLNKAYEELTRKQPKVCMEEPVVRVQPTPAPPPPKPQAQPQPQPQRPCCDCACSSNQNQKSNMRSIRSDFSAGEPQRRAGGGGFFYWVSTHLFGSKKKHHDNGFRHY